MNKPIFINYIVLLMLSVATACADGDKTSLRQNDELPVSILDGLNLGSLLAEPEELNSLAKLKYSLSEDWYASVSVQFQDDAATQQDVKNCRDYFKAYQEGKNPVKEYERSAYIEFGLMCLAARDTADARSAESTYLKPFELNRSTPEVLPKQLAMQLSVTEYKKTLEDKNKVHWSDVNRITGLEKINANMFVYKHSGAQQEIAVVAKGDFNNDGVEDLLITSRDSVIDGSYDALRMFLLTKLAHSAEFVLLKEYKAI